VIIADRLVLPAEVEIVPVAALSAETRARFAHGDTDFVVSRPRARDVSRVIDTAAAALLSRFRVPKTVADAVLEYSRTAGADPELVLLDAWPMLTHLVNDRLLVPEHGRTVDAAAPSLTAGSRVDRWSIARAIHLLEDTELYQVTDDAGRWFALKLARRPPGDPLPALGHASSLDHEAAILEHLGEVTGPRLHARGVVGDSPFLVLDWCAGTDIETVAAELRAWPAPDRRRALLELACELAGTYARLHARGVVHGDVHPRNVLVDRHGRVSLLDFAIARRLAADDTAVPRAGVAFFFEPELARAIQAGGELPPATEAGEQYAIAALVYVLLTGVNYRDFPLEQKAFLQAVISDLPIPFADRGAAAWPEVEGVLARALSKEPGDRYASVAEFAAGLRDAAGHAPDGDGGATNERRPAHYPRSPRLVDDAGRAVLGDVIRRAERGGAGAADAPIACTDAPRASVIHGAAGLAYALYRVALVRESADLLSLADLWAARALAATGAPDAFEDRPRGITHLVYSAATPYHTISGVHCVRALIASAVNDAPSLEQSVDAFIASSTVPQEPDPDLMLGHAGVLLAAALLLDTVPVEHGGPRRRLAKHGNALLREGWRTLAAYPAMPDCPRFHACGAAHGWTGVLYATLRWCAATGCALPAPTALRLDELASHAEPWGRGVRWPHSLAPDVADRHTYLSGWCNGSAGLVHLWTLAARVTGDERFAQLAEGSAWSTWEQASDQSADICCGLAGAAYALLTQYRATGEAAWLRRGATLAARAARVVAADPPLRPDSLYHGVVGVALLVADLERPERASMPFFGDDGWGHASIDGRSGAGAGA
jgi:eukaryotic-like serine/threonine-protein kinase